MSVITIGHVTMYCVRVCDFGQPFNHAISTCCNALVWQAMHGYPSLFDDTGFVEVVG